MDKIIFAIIYAVAFIAILVADIVWFTCRNSLGGKAAKKRLVCSWISFVMTIVVLLLLHINNAGFWLTVVWGVSTLLSVYNLQNDAKVLDIARECDELERRYNGLR